MYSKTLIGKMKSTEQALFGKHRRNGTGKRISLKDTRAIIDAILDGSIDKAQTDTIPIMNLKYPTSLPKVSEGILNPRDTYADVSEWETKAKDLASRYINYFKQYEDSKEGKDWFLQDLYYRKKSLEKKILKKAGCYSN